MSENDQAQKEESFNKRLVNFMPFLIISSTVVYLLCYFLMPELRESKNPLNSFVQIIFGFLFLAFESLSKDWWKILAILFSWFFINGILQKIDHLQESLNKIKDKLNIPY